jgi:hypothetical protein
MTFRLGLPVRNKSSEVIVVCEQGDGMFRELAVSDFEVARTLWYGALCHGSTLIEPAIFVGSEKLSPGPIPEAA